MAWYGWLALAVSMVGCVWGWRGFFRAIIAGCHRVEWGDVIFCILFATMLCWLWPVLLASDIVRAVFGPLDAGRVARVLGGESRKDKMARRERKVQEREDRVRRMEQDLEIAIAR
jgi:hypothetical protein